MNKYKKSELLHKICKFVNAIILFIIFQTRHQLEKLLDWENSHLYHKLGLHWKLARQRCDSTLMMEYVSFHTLFLLAYMATSGGHFLALRVWEAFGAS